MKKKRDFFQYKNAYGRSRVSARFVSITRDLGLTRHNIDFKMAENFGTEERFFRECLFNFCTSSVFCTFLT